MKALLIDSDDARRQVLSRLLQKHGFETVPDHDLLNFRGHMMNSKIDLLVCAETVKDGDDENTHQNGRKLLQDMVRRNNRLRLILISDDFHLPPEVKQ